MKNGIALILAGERCRGTLEVVLEYYDTKKGKSNSCALQVVEEEMGSCDDSHMLSQTKCILPPRSYLRLGSASARPLTVPFKRVQRQRVVAFLGRTNELELHLRRLAPPGDEAPALMTIGGVGQTLAVQYSPYI